MCGRSWRLLLSASSTSLDEADADHQKTMADLTTRGRSLESRMSDYQAGGAPRARTPPPRAPEPPAETAVPEPAAQPTRRDLKARLEAIRARLRATRAARRRRLEEAGLTSRGSSGS